MPQEYWNYFLKKSKSSGLRKKAVEPGPLTTRASLFSAHLQVTHFGCKSFALLFDDIDHNICPADKEVFSSFAHAQVSITNEIFQYLGEPETFLFCPTGNQ